MNLSLTCGEVKLPRGLKQRLCAGKAAVCVLPSRSCWELVDCAERPLEGDEAFATQVAKASDFALATARRKLRGLGVAAAESLWAALEGNEQMLRAAGGLLCFLEQHGLGGVQELGLFSPQEAVFVDRATLVALQVFQEPLAAGSEE